MYIQKIKIEINTRHVLSICLDAVAAAAAAAAAAFFFVSKRLHFKHMFGLIE